MIKTADSTNAIIVVVESMKIADGVIQEFQIPPHLIDEFYLRLINYCAGKSITSINAPCFSLVAAKNFVLAGAIRQATDKIERLIQRYSLGAQTERPLIYRRLLFMFSQHLEALEPKEEELLPHACAK